MLFTIPTSRATLRVRVRAERVISSMHDGRVHVWYVIAVSGFLIRINPSEPGLVGTKDSP
jgi:hypothetical protein